MCEYGHETLDLGLPVHQEPLPLGFSSVFTLLSQPKTASTVIPKFWPAAAGAPHFTDHAQRREERQRLCPALLVSPSADWSPADSTAATLPGPEVKRRASPREGHRHSQTETRGRQKGDGGNRCHGDSQQLSPETVQGSWPVELFSDFIVSALSGLRHCRARSWGDLGPWVRSGESRYKAGWRLGNRQHRGGGLPCLETSGRGQESTALGAQPAEDSTGRVTSQQLPGPGRDLHGGRSPPRLAREWPRDLTLPPGGPSESSALIYFFPCLALFSLTEFSGSGLAVRQS